MGLKTIKRKSGPFISFLGRKIVFLVITIFLAMSLVFILPHLMPSNPADILVSKIVSGASGTTLGQTGIQGGQYSGSTHVEVLKQVYTEKFGINDPLYVQYIDFWKRFLTLDFGISYWRYPQPVTSLVAQSLPWTIALVIPVVPIGFTVGNWIGSRAAYYRGRLDKILYISSMYLCRAPYYWFALLFMYIFSIKLGLFPSFGAFSSSWTKPVLSFSWFADALHHYALPFFSLLGIGIGGWAVGMRAMTIYEMESDYMHYSKQLGFSRSKLRQYAEKNAILPNFTFIPLTLAGLIGQTLLVEIVFNYPGVGTLLYNAVLAMDYPLIEATFVITVMIVLVGNFVADIAYGVIDPRVGKGYVEER